MSQQDTDDFGVLKHDNINYEFDSLNESHTLFRVTNKDTGIIYNITEYDYDDDYIHMPEVTSLMRFIENQVEFTIMDWVNYYTKDYPAYSGVSIDIWKDTHGKNTYIRQKISQASGFIIINPEMPLSTGGFYYVAAINDGATVINTLLHETNETGVSINNTPNQVTDWIKYTLNNEHLLNCVRCCDSNDNEHHIELNNRVWQLTALVEWSGVTLNLNDVSKVVTFEYKGYNYVIPERGRWSKSKVPDKNTPMFGSKYMFNTYVTREENSFVTAIVNMLNETVKNYPVVLEQSDDTTS